MKRRSRRDGWFLQRGYAHIDRPLRFESAKKLVEDRSKVAKLSFFPLLGYAEKKRRFGRDNSIRAVPKRLRPKIIKSKIRELKYASHRDSYVYSYYSALLQERYERFLAEEGLQSCVVGYRSGIGSNIDLAALAFAEISSRQSCTVYCYDIENFFPSIPHGGLKAALSRVLAQPLLEKDWYNIYRSISRFNWIDIDQLFFWCLINPKQGVPNPLCNDPVRLLEDLRSHGMIRRNPPGKGIPQGTPISAVLANVSMLQFDLEMNQWSKSNDAFYMRYSDDIILVTDNSDQDDVDGQISAALSLVGPTLAISSDKTEISQFTLVGGKVASSTPITYLGFTFDGQDVRLRDRTLSRYYRRMTYATRRTDKTARQAFKKGGTREPFKRTLFAKFSHLGKSNFYTYGMRAQGTFGGQAIRKQLRRHFTILLRKLRNRGR